MALTTHSRGLLAAAGAFTLWGLFPLYWRQLQEVPALEIMAHRLIWCCAFVGGWLFLSQGRHWWREALSQPRTRRNLLASSLFIGANWWLYIWAVNNGHIVEASLGYFINPLVNIMLGTIVLGERLNRVQWLTVGLAAVGVTWLTIDYGRPPWIALCLAGSFAIYGLLRKLTPVGSVTGLGIEASMLAPIAVVTVGLLWTQEALQFGHVAPWQSGLLILGGGVTAIPLILFAYGAQRINYSTVGLLQYIGPTLQLIIGVAIYGEAFERSRLVGFLLIWTALALYAADGVRRFRQRPRPAGTAPLAADQ
jgi:chloramphenicol-sensitive protein RarD